MTLMFSQVQKLSASGMFSWPSEIVPKAQMQGINYIKTKQETSLSLKKKNNKRQSASFYWFGSKTF